MKYLCAVLIMFIIGLVLHVKNQQYHINSLETDVHSLVGENSKLILDISSSAAVQHGYISRIISLEGDLLSAKSTANTTTSILNKSAEDRNALCTRLLSENNDLKIMANKVLADHKKLYDLLEIYRSRYLDPRSPSV